MTTAQAFSVVTVPEQTYRVNSSAVLSFAGLICPLLSAPNAEETMTRKRWWWALALAAGCATPYQGGVVTKDGTRYHAGNGPEGWSRQGFEDNDVAFVSPDARHTVAVNATCHKYPDASLEVLMNHLLMGFTEVKALDKAHAPLDGRDSLRGHYQARLDGVPVELGLVVLKKDGCIYDFTYFSPPGNYGEALGAFDQVLHDFQTEGS
jgi:hypothetical protein